MKIIFREEHVLPDFADQWITPLGIWNPVEKSYGPRVDTVRRFRFLATTTAHYDRNTGALIIDLKTTLYDSSAWRPADRKVLELHNTREAALRRTIQIADDWYNEVLAAIPPEYTEDAILASYHAGQPLVKVLEGGD